MEDILAEITTDGWRLIALAIVLAIGSVLQGAVGFAAGLLGIPVLLWLNWSVPESQAIVIASTAVQNIWGILRYRQTLTLHELWFPAFLRISFIPLGILALLGMEQLSMDRIKQMVGGILLLITFALIWIHPKPKEEVSSFWTWVAFPLSGFMQGLIGMGGPAMVLWVQAHDWSTQRSRAFLFALYLMSLPFSMTFLYLTFGDVIWHAFLVTIFMLPIVIASTAAGLWLGTRLGRRRLRRATLVILIILAIANLMAPYLTITRLYFNR